MRQLGASLDGYLAETYQYKALWLSTNPFYKTGFYLHRGIQRALKP